MKVTFCAYDRPGYLGGPNAGLVRLLPALKARGLHPSCLLLTFGDSGQCPTLRTLQNSGIPVEHTLYHATTEERVYWLLKEVKKNRPDVFIPNLMPAAYFAAAHLKKAGIPSIGVLRSDDDFHWQLVDLFAKGRTRDFIDNWVTVSSFLKSQIHDTVSRVEAIPSSIDPMSGSGVEYTEPLRIIYTGRLAEKQKRISLLTESLCKLTEARQGVEATILGNGPARDNVVKILEAHSGAKVFLQDPVNSQEVGNILADHHAIILTSEYEGMPLSLLEGMGAGLVPLVTPVRSGIPELIKQGETGFLLNDLDKDLNAAVTALKDAKTFKRMSEAASSHVHKYFSPKICADKWTEFLKLAAATGCKKSTHIPLFLNLPRHNGIREDDRASRLHSIRIAASSMLSSQHHPFTNPSCRPGFVDLFTVRAGILRAIKKILPQMRNNVVDIGAGNAPYRNLYLNAPDVNAYMSVDLHDSQYNTPDMEWDGKTLPLGNESAGTLVLTEVLEHCENPGEVLREAMRVLEPDGLLFLTIPFLWPLHDIPYDMGRYTPWALKKMLEDAGYAKIEIHALGGYDAAMAQMTGLYARRRSRAALYTSVIRPLLSLATAPVIWLLNKMDNPSDDFREGLMITGLYATARKQGSANE